MAPRVSEVSGEDSAAATSTSAGFARSLAKVGLSLLLLAALVAAVRASGVVEHLDAERLRAAVAELGWLGPAGFVLIYVVGIVAHVPGAVFVGSAVLAYGTLWGLLLSYVGATAANLTCFGLARAAARIGGPGAGGPEQERRPGPAARLLAVLRQTSVGSAVERRPVVAITAARVIFPTTAALSFAIALMPVRFGTYAVASMVGLLPQLVATVLLFGWALAPT